MVKEKCVCGSDEIIEFLSLKQESKSILRCKKCALAWTYPTPFSDYNNYDFSGYVKNKKVHQAGCKQILDFVQLYKKKGRLLELGCGAGLLLELAKTRNFQVKGIDISDTAVKLAKKLVGHDAVEKADIANLNLNDRPYDCVVMDNVLEHAQDPLQLLVSVKNFLKKDGILLIHSPNIDGLYVKLIKANTHILRPREHIWQLSIEAIKYLLEKAGYSIIRIKTKSFVNMQMFLSDLSFFTISKYGIKTLSLNTINYLLGKLGLGDMFMTIAKKAI